ncbi:hypothetical protein [Streptomyces sp. NPDC005093]
MCTSSAAAEDDGLFCPVEGDGAGIRVPPVEQALSNRQFKASRDAARGRDATDFMAPLGIVRARAWAPEQSEVRAG